MTATSHWTEYDNTVVIRVCRNMTATSHPTEYDNTVVIRVDAHPGSLTRARRVQYIFGPQIPKNQYVRILESGRTAWF